MNDSRNIESGGGHSGVNVEGDLADCVASANRNHPRLRANEPKVTTRQDADRLLLALPESLGLAAAESLRSRRAAQRPTRAFAQVAGLRLTGLPARMPWRACAAAPGPPT